MTLKKKKAPARMLVTVVRSGDAPKPPFPIKTGKKLEKSENQPQINHRNYPLFLSLIFTLRIGCPASLKLYFSRPAHAQRHRQAPV